MAIADFIDFIENSFETSSASVTPRQQSDIPQALIPSSSGGNRPLPRTGSVAAEPSATGWLGRALNRPDPLFQFDWDVIVKGPNGIAIPSEYIEEIQCPNFRTESEGVFRASSKTYIAKHYDISAVTLRLYEDQRLTSLKALRSWFNAIHKPGGDYEIPARYKGEIRIMPKNVEQATIATLILRGVFPTTHPTIPFTSQNERTTYDVEFSVDGLDIEF